MFFNNIKIKVNIEDLQIRHKILRDKKIGVLLKLAGLFPGYKSGQAAIFMSGLEIAIIFDHYNNHIYIYEFNGKSHV